MTELLHAWLLFFPATNTSQFENLKKELDERNEQIKVEAAFCLITHSQDFKIVKIKDEQYTKSLFAKIDTTSVP